MNVERPNVADLPHCDRLHNYLFDRPEGATSASAALGLARQSYQIEIFVLAPRRHNGCVAKAALRFLSYATLSQWGPVSMWFDRQ